MSTVLHKIEEVQASESVDKDANSSGADKKEAEDNKEPSASEDTAKEERETDKEAVCTVSSSVGLEMFI